MTGKRDSWQRVELLFAGALKLPPEERARFVERESAGDEALAAEVLDLLAAHDDSDSGFLEELDPDAARRLLERDASPEGLGPWRTVRRLGAGGMGVVYLAERTDGHFEQTAAIKLVRQEANRPETIERFLRERQILARLEHPRIARLLDGGVTPSGQPWFAIEYVEGEPLTTSCDTRALSVHGRLRLFCEVCTAVEYAHRALVIHRDLKPSNILVDGEGQVKLLDFGIAKLLDGEGDATVTQTALRALTPQYGAPEQILGGAITTATDVYSLGALLYELLCGARPRDFDTAELPGIAAALDGDPPPRPSVRLRDSSEERAAGRPSADRTARDRATTPAQLERALSGDLDTIVMKALRREPERRYPSAEALREDIQRHLAGLPVRARADTARYRAGKFVRRHRVSVVAGALVFLTLVGGITASLWNARRAERSARQANEVRQFLIEMFEESHPSASRGETVTARELLDRGADEIENKLADDPETRTEMMSVIAGLYYSLGAYDRSVELFSRAIDERRAFYGERHPFVGETLYRRGQVFETLARYEEAESDHRAAIDILRTSRGSDHTITLSAITGLALVLSDQGEYDEAEVLQREALTRLERSGLDEEEIAGAEARLGLTLRWKGDFQAAEELHRSSLERFRRVLGNDHPDTAWAMERLGVGLGQRGDFEASETFLREGLETMERILPSDHPDIPMAMNNLAKLYAVQSRWDDAEPLYREALARNLETWGEENRRVSTNLTNLAEVIASRGGFDEALELQQRALGIRTRTLGADHPRVVQSHHDIARTAQLAGDLTLAEESFRAAAEGARRVWEETHPRLGAILAGYGALELDLDRPERAEELLAESLRVREASLLKESWEISMSRALLAECRLALGEAEALPELEAAHRELLDRRGADDPFTRRAARVLDARGDRPTATR